MNSADKIKRLFEKAELGINLDTDEKIFQDVFQAQQEINRNAPILSEIWRITMKSPVTKLAMAAVFIIACLIGLFFWKGTGSGIALAEVLERIEQVTAYQCQLNMTFKSKNTGERPISQATILISQIFGAKITIEVDNPITGQKILEELYMLPPQKTITTLMPNEKKYSQVELDEAYFKGWREEYDPRELVKQILTCEHKSLGRTNIDGIECEGFQKLGPGELKIWVDVKTRLPVRMEGQVKLNEGKENEVQMNTLLHDCHWGMPVNAADFEPVIPDDYTLGQSMLQQMFVGK
jgi:hypothetical protein